MTSRGKGKTGTRGRGGRSKTPANNDPKKSLDLEKETPITEGENQNSQAEMDLDHPVTGNDSQENNNQNTSNIPSGKFSTLVTGTESQDETSAHCKSSTPVTVSESQEETNTQMNGSRYQNLEKTCNYCDQLCIEAPGMRSENLQCYLCGSWAHMNCTLLEQDVVLEIKAKNSYLCTSCQQVENDENTFGPDSTMNSEDRFRAEYDVDMDTEFEEEILRETDKPEMGTRDTALKSAPLEPGLNVVKSGVVLKSTTNTHISHTSVPEVESASVENRNVNINLPYNREERPIGTNMMTHENPNRVHSQYENPMVRNNCPENSNQTNLRNQMSSQENSELPPFYRTDSRNDQLDQSRYDMNIPDYRPIINARNEIQPQTNFVQPPFYRMDNRYDQHDQRTFDRNMPDTRPKTNTRKQIPPQENFELPPFYRMSSRNDQYDQRNSDREGNSGHRDVRMENTGFDNKMNELLSMVKDMRENIHSVEDKVKSQDQKYDILIKNSADQINANVQRTITDTLATQNRENREELNREIDRRVKVSIDRQVEQNIVSRVDNAINKMNSRIGTEIDRAVHDRMQHLEQRVHDSHRQNIEGIVDQRIEGHLDDFQDALWRQRNLLIVNLPESRNPDVKARMYYDMDEVYRIFNLFVEFDESDVECMPVRLGRIGDKPRLLRVTLKSERMINTIVNRAREQNHLLNPNERDPQKKIYINRDYSEKERVQRKRAIDEKKERERNGESNLEIRRGKVVVKGQGGRFSHNNSMHNNQENRTQNRPQQQNRDIESQSVRERSESRNRQTQNYQTALRDYLNSNLNLETNMSNYQQNTQKGPQPQRQRNENSQSRGRSQSRNRHYQSYQTTNIGYQTQSANQTLNNKPRQNIDSTNQSSRAPRQTCTNNNNPLEQMQTARNHPPTQNNNTERQNINNYNQPYQMNNNSGRSPFCRDEQGTYIRDGTGREIRGAEGGRSPARDRSELGRNVNHNETDHYGNDRREREGPNRSGRAPREASRQYNRNKPGSRPYGGQYFGQN